MQDLNPYAVFLGGIFAMGFVARAVIGSYRRVTRKNSESEIEIEVTELHKGLKDRLRSLCEDESKAMSEFVNKILEAYVDKPFIDEDDDEAGDRQNHFSLNEKVRISDLNYLDKKCFYKKGLNWPEKLRSLCDLSYFADLHELLKENSLGEIVGFVMKGYGKDCSPYMGGTAIVRTNLREGVCYAAFNFKGLLSLDNGIVQNSTSELNVGDWVHWKTQAGHISLRPSVIFKTRKKKLGIEVQLGYTQSDAVKKFWCPASKCKKTTIPTAFLGTIAQQLTESVLAQKLKTL